jgi:choline-sulfatase
MPKLYAREERPRHPYVADYGRNFNYDDYFEGPA